MAHKKAQEITQKLQCAQEKKKKEKKREKNIKITSGMRNKNKKIKEDSIEEYKKKNRRINVS